MKLKRIIMTAGLITLLVASTATAGGSLWLSPKNIDGTDIDDAYVGPNDDPWLHESYVVGADPFILEIYNHSRGKGKGGRTAKNVRVVVAINDPENLSKIIIGDEEFLGPGFEDEEGYGTPKLASGRRMPKHGIFPTWFVEVPIGDIAQNEAAEEQIEVYGNENLMVHFDAYGEGSRKKGKGKSHHKEYKGKSHHKEYKGKSHHKEYKGKSHHKGHKGKAAHTHDVYNPFSHDLTVVAGISGPAVCGPDDISIVFYPESLDYLLPDREDRTFEISVELEEGSYCNVNNTEFVVSFPQYVSGGDTKTVFSTVSDVSNPDDSVPLNNTVNTWSNVSLPILKAFQLSFNNSTPNGNYTVEAYLIDSDGTDISSNTAEVKVIPGGPQ